MTFAVAAISRCRAPLSVILVLRATVIQTCLPVELLDRASRHVIGMAHSISLID
jgi:hypothetical protein